MLRSKSSFAHKKLDAASYDGATAAFDSLTERFSTPLALEMLRLAQIEPGNCVLDAGTGTGLVALQAARAVTMGRIVGIDHSHGMLLASTQKAITRGLDRCVCFARMDAEALGFADASFDVVLSLFVFFHLPNPLDAIKEFHRVLSPRGRIVIGVGRGPHLASRAGLEQAARRAAAKIAVARKKMLIAPGFLAALMKEKGLWPEQEHVARSNTVKIPELLLKVGFHDVTSVWHGRWAELNADDFWQVQATYSSTERIRLAELQPDQLAELKATFYDRCNRVLARSGRLVYPFGAMFYTAQR